MASRTDVRARRRVRLLAGSRVVSAGGSQAAQVALVYEIYSRTHSGLWVMATLAASVGAGGVLSPVSGLIADRFDRQRVMVTSELTAGVAYLAMVFTNRPLLLVCGALTATILGAPFRAASAAAIPNLVDPTDLPWANGLLGTAFNFALVAGPFVGGALVAASGAGLVFAVNAATFLASAALIAGVRGEFGGHLGRAVVASDALRLLDGFRTIVATKSLTWLTASSAFAWAAFGSALVIDPVLARHFHAGSIGYGLLTTVWGGGAVLGAVIAGRTVRLERASNAVEWGMALMAVSLGSIVILPSFALIVAAGAIGGVGSGFVFIPWLLLVQHGANDSVRGRVIAAAEAFDQIAFFTGMALAVPGIAVAGPHHAYAVAGLMLTVATVAAAQARRREVRSQD